MFKIAMDTVSHIWNSSTWEAEPGELLKVQGQTCLYTKFQAISRLQSKFLSKKKKEEKRKRLA